MVENADVTLDPIQISMLEYWTETKGDMAVPLLVALDPLKFDSFALPYLILAEYLNDQGTVLYRLVGEEMVQRWGGNFRGKRSDEMFAGDYRAFLERCFALSRAERCPVYSEGVFRWNDGGWVKTTRLMLPFSAEPNGVPTRVVVVQVFLDAETPQVIPEIRLLREPDMSGGIVVPLIGR